jgi:hypothetical protein
MIVAGFIQCRLFIVIILSAYIAYIQYPMVALQLLQSVKNNFSCSDEICLFFLRVGHRLFQHF